MDRDQTHRKIAALQALQACSNASDSGLVLRTLQAVMAEIALHQIASEITCIDAKRGPGSTGVAPWRTVLAVVVAGAFQTRVLRVNSDTTHRFRFFGEPTECAISAEAYDVLERQLVAALRHHLRRVRIAKNRIARGDAFALAWISTVAQALEAPSIGAVLAARINATIEAAFPERFFERDVASSRRRHQPVGMPIDPRQTVQLRLELAP